MIPPNMAKHEACETYASWIICMDGWDWAAQKDPWYPVTSDIGVGSPMAVPEIAQVAIRRDLPKWASPKWGLGCTSPTTYRVIPKWLDMSQEWWMTKIPKSLSQDLVDRKMRLIVPLRGCVSEVGTCHWLQLDKCCHSGPFLSHILL